MSSLQATMDESSGNLFMLPGMSSPEVENLQLHIDSGGRVVRFDNECVLIPELNAKKQRPSMVITKSYSLPLWKKKGGQNQPLSDSDADAEEATQTQTQRGSARSPSPSEDRLVIKVPIPTFRRRTSRSPTRGRSVSASPAVPSRLPPCLVHRGDRPSLMTSTSSPSTSSLHGSMTVRRPSLPIYHRRRDDAGYIQTIPLRDCCQACETITEECLKLGESWQEKFSRGARRRRSASLDQQEATSIKLASLHSRTASLGACIGGGDSSSTSKLTLTVDEVDKRRKSLDLQEHPPFFSFVSPSDTPSVHDKDLSASSTSTTGTTSTTPPAEEGLLANLNTAIPDILMGSPDRHRIYRSSPIQEEDDEAQLFPLPRRSPSGTPSPKISPAQSPNGSAVNLALPTEAGGRCSPSRRVSGSRESVASSASSSNRSNTQRISQKQSNSSQESFLKASLSRKPATGVGMGYAGPNNNGRLSVPSTPSGSRNSSPTSKLAGSTLPSSKSQEKTGLRISTAPATIVAKAMATQGRISPSSSSVSMKNKGKDKPMPPLPVSTLKNKNVERPLPSPTLPTTPEDATLSMTSLLPSLTTPPPASSLSSTPPIATPVSPRLSPTSPRSPGAVPSSPPSQSTMGKRKLSLTAPFLKAGGALRGVSADVLKGVSSFGGGF